MSNMSYSPYGVMKRVGELYTMSLGGLIVKFWNVYGIEKDMEKAHVITDFIRKGFETGVIDMMTCLLYTSPSPRDATLSRMPSSA